jgi:hypothetical protein
MQGALNEHSGLGLHFAKPTETNGTTLQQWKWRGLDSQKWRQKAIVGARKRGSASTFQASLSQRI